MSLLTDHGYSPSATEVLASQKASKAGLAARKGEGSKAGHPTTSEMDYTPDQLEYLNAIQAFKQSTGHKFPTWTEAFNVFQSLGYSRTKPEPAQEAIPERTPVDGDEDFVGPTKKRHWRACRH